MNPNKSWKTTLASIIMAAAIFATQNPDLAAIIGPLGIKIATFVSLGAGILFGNAAKDKDKTGIEQ